MTFNVVDLFCQSNSAETKNNKMKYANFKDDNGNLFSFEVSNNFDVNSNSYDRILENFVSNEGCKNGEFVSLTDEPVGETY